MNLEFNIGEYRKMQSTHCWKSQLVGTECRKKKETEEIWCIGLSSSAHVATTFSLVPRMPARAPLNLILGSIEHDHIDEGHPSSPKIAAGFRHN